MIFIDLETRSRVDIKVHGGWRYVQDDSTELLCGVALDVRTDPATVYVWTPFEVPLSSWEMEPDYLRQLNTPPDALRYAAPLLGSDDPPDEVLRAAAEGVPLVAHNAWGFDAVAWEQLGLPGRWLDMLPRARRRGLPGYLHRIGQTLYGLGKDSAGQRVLMTAAKPMSRGRRRGEFLDPDGPRLSAIVRYCLRDVMLMATTWMDEGLGDPHPDDDVLEVDRVINWRGVQVDLQAVADLQRVEARHVEEHEARAAEVLALPHEEAATLLRSPLALKRWLADHGCPVPDVTAPTLVAALGRADLPEEARTIIEARLAVAHVTGGKTAALVNRTCTDRRLRGTMAYGSAHTGRWAGRGFQPQNLPRPVKDLPEDIHEHPDDAPLVARELKVDTAQVLGSMLRGVLVAPAGLLLAIVDLANIEGRGLLWLAGDEEGLEVFRRADRKEGPDVYRVAAATIYQVPVERVTKAQRQVGKVATLALGYQGGPGAFLRMAESYGVDVSDLDLTQIVEAWRDGRPLVAGWRKGLWTTPEGRTVVTRRGGLWRELKRAAWDVVLTRQPQVCGRCEWRMEGPHLICELPSGRPLIYRHARVEAVMSRWGTPTRALTYQSNRWKAGRPMRLSTYGGKLAENITQAVCRDLLGHALVQLERAGLRTVLHVHDEVVVEIANAGELADVERLMSDAPAWADGLPVVAEGHASARYGKG